MDVDAFLPWLETKLRAHLGNEQGATEIIVVLLIVFLFWLVLTGRKVVVQ
jgi:hypothetical protein